MLIEGNEALSRQERKKGIKKEFEKVGEMLIEKPEVEWRDEAITDELRARDGDEEMPMFKRITYWYLADEEEVFREEGPMRQGIRRKIPVDYLRDMVPIIPAQKEVPEEDESESDTMEKKIMEHRNLEITGAVIRIQDEGKKESGIEMSGQVEEEGNVSKESMVRRVVPLERERRSPEIKKRKSVGDKSANLSRSIYHSDLSAITATMGDAAIASGQSSDKV